MVRIHLGTSGYSYADWVGPIYPVGTRPRDYLREYCNRFLLTELNFSYYRQPTRETLLAIAERTPPGFRLTVKAHGSLTHERGPDWAAQAEQFGESIEALRDVRGEDKLAGVLLQFPFGFHYTGQNRRYLASVTDALAPVRRFVEFRNDEWETESVWKEMERRELGLVIPDLPALKGLPRITPRLTAPYGYVRFHGRNAQQWWTGTNVTRYDYRYTSEELDSWVGPVQQLAKEAEAVIVTFNNHFGGQAVENAEQFAGMLGLDRYGVSATTDDPDD